jgi:hypothetical protein
MKSFNIKMLDSTSLELTGSLDWSCEPLFDLVISPLQFSRSNLIGLLAKKITAIFISGPWRSTLFPGPAK